MISPREAITAGRNRSRAQMNQTNILKREALATFVAVMFSAAATVAWAQQQQEYPIADQPGYEPSQDDDRPAPAFRMQAVYFRTTEAAGTIIVHTSERYMYLVQGNNRAIRYGIGVGRDGFQWSGLQRISRKSEWPDWTPPPEMIQRQPYLPRWMAGGPGNPMGARAMYLGATVYRIHGTNQPQTIGHAVSSGCFRLVNHDVIDLFNRVEVGAKVVIKHAPSL